MNERVRRYHVSFMFSLPPLVKKLIVGTVLIYIFQVITSHQWDYFFGLNPGLLTKSLALWQPVTYIFLHAGPIHLFWNMIILWMFGSEIELSWGAKRFGVYYVICGAGAGIISVLLDPTSTALVVGASGAIFGVLLAFGIIYPDRMIAFMFVFPMKAKYFVAAISALQLLFFVRGGDGIVAYGAHVGGLITGVIYFWFHRHGWQGIMRRAGMGIKRRHPKLHIIHRPDSSAHVIRRTKPEKADNDEPDIDHILDKISALGLDALTDEERTILEQTSKNLGRRREEDPEP